MAVAVSTPAARASADAGRLSANLQPIWRGVDRLVDRAPHVLDLRAHRLEIWAARRKRALGLPVPEELAGEERAVQLVQITARAVLELVRDTCDGQIIVLKGPEVAARYPDPILRPYGDLDLLLEDPQAAYRALREAGFVGSRNEEEYYDELHHLRPLYLPKLPILVELHRHPNWVAHRIPPDVRELFALAVPSSVGVNGLLALEPEAHAVVLAAHSWGRMPLARLGDLVDVEVMLAHGDRGRADELAQRWGLSDLWHTTLAAADALVFEAPRPMSLRVWARSLGRVEDNSVAETHLRRWLSPFWGLPFPESLRATGQTLGRELLPLPGETWLEKLARSRRAVANAFRRQSEHRRSLGEEGTKLNRRHRARPRNR